MSPCTAPADASCKSPSLVSDGEQPPADQQQELGPDFGKPGTALDEVQYVKRHSHSPLEGGNILFFPITALYREKAFDMYAHTFISLTLTR